MPVHVCDSSGASLGEILPTNVISLNDIWPLCQLLTLEADSPGMAET